VGYPALQTARLGAAHATPILRGRAHDHHPPPQPGEIMEEIGPVDYAIIAFPGSQFTGEIIPAIGDLVDAGTVRVIDAVFVTKTADGDIGAFELSDLDPTIQDAFANVGVEINGLFNEEDLVAAAEELDPGSSAVLLVWENVWARKVAEAVRSANGELLDFGRVPHEIVQGAREWALENFGNDA
jgi:uncharacterized membrane protein